MKPKRIRTQASINRDEWIKLSIHPEEIERRLKYEIIERVSRELINEVDIVIESNGWVGEGWKVDITVMSTDEYIRLTQELENYKNLLYSTRDFISNQQNIPSEFNQIISENFNDLI